MALNFPASPTAGDTHAIGDKTWTWDGTVWNLVTSAGSDHGNLGGLGDDDHTQYLLADGTRTATALTITNDLTVGQNAEVDGILTANHIHGNLAGSVYLHVKNTSGSSIPAGTPVYATGSVGASGATEVSPSDASTAGTMPAIGITQSTLAINAEGHATILGVIGSQDTSTYSLNQPLYVAPGGGLTATRPTAATDAVQSIARVVRVDASSGELLVMGAGRTNDVPNEISILGDLTVDTDTLYVDSTNNRVGIGTTSPNVELHLKKGSGSGVATPFSTSHDIVIDADSDSGIGIYTGTTNNGFLRFGDTDNPFQGGFQYDHTQDLLYTRTGGTNRITVNSSGHQRLLYQPSFVVGHDTGAIGSGNYVTWNRVYVNQGSHFNTSNGRFTIPVDGHYYFWWTALSSQTDDVYRVFLYINGALHGFGVGVQLRLDASATGSEYVQASQQHTTSFSAGDYVQLYFSSDGGNALYGSNDYLRWGGWLIH